MVGRRRRLRTAVLAGLCVGGTLLAGCTSNRGSFAPLPPTSSPASSRTAPASGSGSASGSASCPSSYASPDPRRPKVALDFTVAADLATVKGTEKIAFTPDAQITELVFRLTANTRPTVAAGNKIVVTSASADHGGGTYSFTAANAAPGTQGGLLLIPFASAIQPGTTVTATIGFTVTLGNNSFDRFGRASGYAYFGSAAPLLAWQRGYGWHTEDLIDFTAESATSEAMDTDLTVSAPGRDTVIASGDPSVTSTAAGLPSGYRTWHSTISTARDVSVAVGPFVVSDTTVDGVTLRLGARTASERALLVPEFQRAIRALSARFGPYPFPSLSVARLPAGGGGIEYPSSILMLDSSRLVAVHETAHQWFYAMIGDSQSLHPWLDEAFAQYSEELVNGDGTQENGDVSGDRHPVDASVESYGTNESLYYFTTYNKGAAALLAARQAAGALAWDRAVRCYVAANAWRIVEPGDFRKAIARFLKAVAVLTRAGAFR